MFMSITMAIETNETTGTEEEDLHTFMTYRRLQYTDECKISTSGNSVCGMAYQTLMQNKYGAEACASAYFYQIRNCQTINCVFESLPQDACSCKSSFNSLSYCLDHSGPTTMCRSTLRVWLNACEYPSKCIDRVTNQLGKCSENSSFGPCLNNALHNATCNTDPANLFNSGSNLALEKSFGIIAVLSVLFTMI